MTVYMPPWKPLVVLGFLSGLVQAVAGVVMYVSGVYFAPWSALVNLLLLLVCIAGGVRWYVTRVLGGRRTYLTGLSAGLVITMCTGLVYVTYNIVSIRFVYPNFLEDMGRALGERPTLSMVAANNLRGFWVWGTILSVLTALAFRKPSARCRASSSTGGKGHWLRRSRSGT